jgi:hypothetical protein
VHIHAYCPELVVLATHQRLLAIVDKGDLCRDIEETEQEQRTLGVPDPAAPDGIALRDLDVQRRLGGGATLDFYRSQPRQAVMIWAIDHMWRVV